MHLLFAAAAASGVPDKLIQKLRESVASSDGSRDTIFAQAVAAPHKMFLQAQRRQLQAREAWQQFFREHDAFIMPAAFVAAFRHDSQPSRLATPEGERPYKDLEAWIAAPTLSGLPVTVAPVGRTGSGLPVGIQIVGPYLEDATTIDIAAQMAPLIGGFMPPPGY